MSGPDSDLSTQAETALQTGYLRRFPAQAATTLEKLPVRDIVTVLLASPIKELLPVWERISPDLAARVLSELPDATISMLLCDIDQDRAARVLAAADNESCDRYLSLLDEETAKQLREIMSFPPDRAAAIMDKGIRLFREDLTIREILGRLRDDRRPGRRGFFVVDHDDKLQGWVDIQDIALAPRTATLAEFKVPPLASVGAMATREEVIEVIEQFGMSELAVVDLEGRLIGVIRPAALIEAEKAQASVGMQTMVGVSKDERALSPISFAVRKRLPWLEINLLTAFLAASVVGLFEQTIAQFTALAILLPVVAGQSGNTGAQALAVTMRGLALREIRVSHWPRVVFKELNVGLWNGVAVAITTALGMLIWSGSAGLTLVIGVSMVISMVIAGAAGAAIPILLTVAGQDPAQSSSIVLTTVTDIAGFFSFLGIATLLMSLL